jgi:hypothetical protein
MRACTPAFTFALAPLGHVAMAAPNSAASESHTGTRTTVRTPYATSSAAVAALVSRAPRALPPLLLLPLLLLPAAMSPASGAPSSRQKPTDGR